jgi:hypothetical protein
MNIDKAENVVIVILVVVPYTEREIIIFVRVKNSIGLTKFGYRMRNKKSFSKLWHQQPIPNACKFGNRSASYSSSSSTGHGRRISVLGPTSLTIPAPEIPEAEAKAVVVVADEAHPTTNSLTSTPALFMSFIIHPAFSVFIKLLRQWQKQSH